MTWVAEFDEPFPIQGARHRLQYPYTLPVVFNHVVVCRQDIRNAALLLYRRHTKIEGQELIKTQIVLGSTTGHALHLKLDGVDVIFEKSRIGFLRVGNKADDAIRKTALNSENRGIRDICRDCDT